MVTFMSLDVVGVNVRLCKVTLFFWLGGVESAVVGAELMRILSDRPFTMPSTLSGAFLMDDWMFCTDEIIGVRKESTRRLNVVCLFCHFLFSKNFMTNFKMPALLAITSGLHMVCKYLFNSTRRFSKNSSLRLLRKLLPGKTNWLRTGNLFLIIMCKSWKSLNRR